MHRILIIAIVLLTCSVVPGLAAGNDPTTGATPPAAAKSPAAPAKPAGPGETIDDAQQYQHCMALARQKPEDAWEEALAWGSLGGGDPARHCGAIALIGLKEYEAGAKRLEDLAKASHGSARLRAGMLAQAGQAWLLAKMPERAYAAQTAALALVPGAPDLLIDRAATLAEAKNYKDALTDLNQVLAVSADRADALTFRAAAKRYLDDFEGAEADITQALKIDPGFSDAWLERGILYRLRGDDVQARQAWLKAIEIAPTSAAADGARRNIELLDVRER